MNLFQHIKNQFIPSVQSSDTVNFRVLSPDWPQPFWTKLTQQIANHLDEFAWIGTSMQKISQFHLFILEIESILEFGDQICPPNFWPCTTWWSTFNFCEFVSMCKNWGCFNNLFRRNNWFKNTAIWLAGSTLAYISGTRFFLNIWFVQDHSKQ